MPENDEAALKKAVAHQPVSVAIEADQKAFQVCGVVVCVCAFGTGHDELLVCSMAACRGLSWSCACCCAHICLALNLCNDFLIERTPHGWKVCTV